MSYAYLILSLQASVRSSIAGNMTSVLTTQKTFLNNFENIGNRRVDIREDIKRHQDTLSYASSKVDYSMGENICKLPSNMNLNIKTRTVRHNNKFSYPIVNPGGGGHTSISLTGMLVQKQISTTQKSRMTLNSNPQKIECPKIQTQKNRMTQDASLSKFE